MRVHPVGLALALTALAFAAPAHAAAAPAGTACSALAFAARDPSSTIQLSEVEADPVLAGADTANEWLELRNISTSRVILLGWSVADSSSNDVLPTVTLAPNTCIVIAATSAGFLSEHAGYDGPVIALANGTIGNGLGNAGDVLMLKDAGGAVADCVVWGSGTGCFSPAVPATPANTSDTLQRKHSPDTDTAADWSAGAQSVCASASTGVLLASFTGGAAGKAGVRLRWRTAAASVGLGFNVWRSARRDGGFAKVNRRLIALRAGTSAYAFVDRVARRGRQLYYRLQVIDGGGRSRWAGSLALRH